VKTYNPDAEESVVGSIMLSHDAARHCQEIGMSSKHFGNSNLGKIFDVVMDNFAEGRTTDPLMAADELDRRAYLMTSQTRPCSSVGGHHPQPRKHRALCRDSHE